MNSYLFTLSTLLVSLCSILTTVEGRDLTIKKFRHGFIRGNSVVSINQIGLQEPTSYDKCGKHNSGKGPLVCNTDHDANYKAKYTLDQNAMGGVWYYPNGEVVNSTAKSAGELDITRDQPAGVYCCALNDTNSVNGSGNITTDYFSAEKFTKVNSSSMVKCIGIYDDETIAICQNFNFWPDYSGYVTYDSPFIPGRVAMFTCNYGYKLVGENILACTSQGWSGHMPRCEVDCGRLKHPENGYEDSYSGSTTESTTTFFCNYGYKLYGTATRICNSNDHGNPYNRVYAASSNFAPSCYKRSHYRIQLKFSPSDFCQQWDKEKAKSIAKHLRNHIRFVVGDSNFFRAWYPNQWYYDSISIKNEFFACRTSRRETTYRATLIGIPRSVTGTVPISSVTMAKIIQKWVESSPSVRVQWYVVDIDSTCPVRISSRLEPECT